MAAGAAKAFNRIISDPMSVFENNMYNQYTNIPESKGYWDKISKIFDSYKPRHEDPNFYSNDVKAGMHLSEPLDNSLPSVHAAEERDYINRDLFNSILADHRRQVEEGINPGDVLTGKDLSMFYNEIYAAGVDPREALQGLAEKLFIERGTESALKKSKSNSSGKIQSFNQKTIKGQDPHRLTQKASRLTLPPEIRQDLTEEELIQLGIKRKAPVKTTMGSGFSGFSGFGKKQ